MAKSKDEYPKTDVELVPIDQLLTPPAEAPTSVVAQGAARVAGAHRIVRFRGRAMVLAEAPYPHFVPLHKDNFDKIAYPELGGISRSKMGDIFAYLANTVEDLTQNDRYILFGTGRGDPEDGSPSLQPSVWDMETLRFRDDVPPDSAVWRSPYQLIDAEEPVPFIMSLAGGDQGVYDDIMQSLAPLVMGKKPDGVIWWIGDGANGKSTLMDAIYHIFPGQLSSITVKRLVDGRDTPSLNGTLANVVKESSEGRVEDTEIYKSLGTHENFRVHKFHTQDDVEIAGNVHHIFSANMIPTFNDKGWSARRRTFIIPFRQRFESDPAFEEKTFTDEMFGRLIAEMCRYAAILKLQGYRYKWSASTLAAKAEYDTDANNAEEYAKHIISEGVVAFESYNPVRLDYDNWCADNGYVPLGITNLRRALNTLGFERMTYRDSADRWQKHYRLPSFKQSELVELSMGRPGLLTISNFKHTKIEEDIAVEAALEDELPEQPPLSRLKGEW